jgi:hypothetical protein
VVTEAPTPLPFRPSEFERERALELLKAASRDGRLSLDTFADRVELAVAARNRAQLDELVSDLPGRGRVRRVLARAVSTLSALVAELRAAWREPRVPRLALPRERAEITVGRAPDCDCVLSDETVSRHHASFRRVDDTWLLTDLKSTNGTRLNGLRVAEQIEVRVGDRVSFGSARYRLTDGRASL